MNGFYLTLCSDLMTWSAPTASIGILTLASSRAKNNNNNPQNFTRFHAHPRAHGGRAPADVF